MNNITAKPNFIIATMFAAVAFLFCAGWIVLNPQRPLPDPTLYEGIAANLASGNGYTFDIEPPYRPEITRTPFLPFVISLLYRVIGRNPDAVLWMNAIFISFAAGLAYFLALRLFKDRVMAVTGTAILVLTPPFTGSANNILTEPLAMLQTVAAALLLLGWKERSKSSRSVLHGLLLGILLATFILNRSSVIVMVLVAAVYVVAIALNKRWKNWPAWLTAGAFSMALSLPVLAWSARNAAIGLAFSPAPIGLYASRVFDIKRYSKPVFDPYNQVTPAVNDEYFLHWQLRYGPEELIALEKENKRWFEQWRVENGDQILTSLPKRFLGLFSFFRTTIYPPWPNKMDWIMRIIMRGMSRVLWILALTGFLIERHNRAAKYIFLIPILSILAIHLPTVCHERYVFPLFPVHMPFVGVAIVALIKYVRNLVYVK